MIPEKSSKKISNAVGKMRAKQLDRQEANSCWLGKKVRKESRV